MKVLNVTDLHGSRVRFRKVAVEVEEKKPDLIVFGADILPKGARTMEDMIKEQRRFIDDFLVPYLKNLSETYPESLFVIDFGNDDCMANYRHFVDCIAEIEGKNVRISNMHGFSFKGVTICGAHAVPDYPFRLKDWCMRDTEESGICVPNFGLPIYTANDNCEPELSYEKDFSRLEKKGTIWQCMEILLRLPKMDPEIWIMHPPPDGVGLDRCNTGEHVGSKAIRNFIEKRQPLITLHGHIHEVVETSGKWWNKIRDTYVIQPGVPLGEGKVRIVLFDTDDIEETLEAYER